MDAANKVDDNELQKAINNITGAGAAPETDAVAAVTEKIEADNMAALAPAPAPEIPDGVAMPNDMAATPAEDVQNVKATYGDPDLGAVKVRALSDLRPLLDKVELSPEAKFKIYKEIIVMTNDKAAIEPAYVAAGGIAIEKDRAEALLFVVEMIDKLGVGLD